MIKLLIVDDERHTREGLATSVNWTSLGIDYPELAEDGIKGFEAALRLLPDIIISDVRMPRMNGIEFATKVRQHFPETQIIFLSGYSDKDYLKSAIKLNAVEYVEKPIDNEEVFAAVRKAVEVINSRKTEKSKFKAIENRLEKNIPLVRQRLAVELLNGVSDINEFSEKAELAKINFPPQGGYLSLVLKLNLSGLSQSRNEDEFRSCMLAAVEEFFNKRYSDFICGYRDFEQLIIHLYLDEKKDFVNKSFLLEDLRLHLADAWDKGGSWSIGVGEKVIGINNITLSFETAVEAVRKQFFWGYGQVFQYKYDKEAKQFRFSDEVGRSFTGLLRECRTEEAVTLIGELTGQIKIKDTTEVNYIKNIFFNLLIKLYEVVMEKGISASGLERERDFLWETLLRFNTLDEISAHLINEISSLADYMKAPEENKTSTAINQVVKYIKQNYQENFSIKELAERAYLTHTYLCLLFKKETGKTINNFITEVKIEKSKEFLRDRRLSLAEVSERVGFSDANYYAKVFKKLVGINPSEYRGKSAL